ncbi:polyprenyl synthetase family protein [Hamadaea tsunoensis]|uniref:polyprenyl synthetase family protein n=1 Tax=Hamadaea tsunoensis TaxID=53368 RepID=UPI0006848810|nr:polyprenyl synthetase family protein [Hamadaea tsunoensis]
MEAPGLVPPTEEVDLRRRVDRSLRAFLAARRTQLTSIDPELAPVSEAIDALVLGGGKRLRPAFAYWGYRAAGGTDSDAVVTAASALELVQASALIHDDLIDRSDTRRGEPSAHVRFTELHGKSDWHGDGGEFGAAAAILLGDACLVWSDEMLHASGLDPVTLARARPVFDAMRTEVTAGQYLDVLTQATGDTSLRRASTVARFKSAKYTVERPLLLGAAIADAPAGVRDAYSAFGLPIGEAFQLRDDVLGVFGDPLVTGKPAGDDLREGKRTYLVAAAFQAADDRGRQVLADRLGDPHLTAADVHDLREVFERSGALRRTEERIEELTSTALAALGEADLTGEGRTMLLRLAAVATQRNT